MENFIRATLRGFFRFFKVDIIWLKNPRKYPQKVLYISNHVSTLDILFLYAFLPGRLCFAINKKTAKNKLVRFFMRYADLMLFNPLDPNDVKKLVAVLDSGQSCVIFPERNITTTGNLMKIYEASGVVADRAKVSFVPVWIEGAQYGYSSRLKDKKGRRLFPRTTITVQKSIDFKISEQGRKNRNYISNEIYQLMQNVAFKASFRPTASFFADFMRAAKNNAHEGLFSRPQIAEDIDRITYSYKDLCMKAYQYGSKLNKFIKHQEAVGVLLGNSIQNLNILLALLAYERVPAMINHTSGVANVLSTLKTTKIKNVITSKEFLKNNNLQNVVDEIKKQGISIIYIEDINATIKLKNVIHSWFLYKKKFVPYPCSGHRKAVILFTSGSEGQPKAIVLSHQNLVANIRQFSSAIDINRTDLVFCCLPMFHSFGLVVGVFAPLLCGGKVFIYPSPLHHRNIPEMIYDTGATVLLGTDSFLKSYAKVAHPFDFHTLRFVFAGAEPIQMETRHLWMEKFGIRLLEAYGSTECSPLVTINNRIFCNFNSIGKILPGIEYKIKKIDGIENAGSLMVKGPNIMMGTIYSKNPGVIVPPSGGWFDTGDIVSIDDMGFVYLKGRLKRFAKIAGEMVSLPSLEILVKQAYPNQEFECTAVAIPHETKGEQIILVSTAKDMSLDKLQTFIKQQGYTELYVPKTIVYREELPVLGSGKRDFVGLKQEIESMFLQN
ncbi:MAG: hypothetical protein E7013_00365 [Alphaproteobacteria bacterium]|nr:hypothetical protein [Alphaproteobacteria bacterium]